MSAIILPLKSGRSVSLVVLLLAGLVFSTLSSHAHSQACNTAAQTAMTGLLGQVSSARGTTYQSPPAPAVGDGSCDQQTDADYSASDYYVQTLDPIIQGRCIVCHNSGGAAASWQPPARILFTSNATNNHQALEAFVTSDGVGADWLLDKIVGDANHGGGAVLTAGSEDFVAFETYLDLVFNTQTASGGSAAAFWEGTAFEDRGTTLRRAAFILSGSVPDKGAIRRAKESEEGLRKEILRLMSGEGFHDFLIYGANDRLLTSGLNAGVDFQFDFWSRFPAFTEFARQLPDDRPEEFNTDEYWDKPFLTQNEAQNEFRQAVIREPLELIAYIVENNRTYKEVVTADYTMVNPFSALGYRSDVTFDVPLHDEQGFFDRRLLNEFKPAQNKGHIPFDQNTQWSDEGWIENFSGYHDWPHAGVLSMPAWLGRYPSTDTNRNRARSRWTYFHFLDVDIEKSAPRTTDPVALADTNNPTMNNPACTVCHVRMDPVAGAYQKFGDQGHYLDQWGGLDSLPESYKRPQRPLGEPNALERDPALNQREFQFFTRRLTFSTGGSGGTFTVNDISPNACLRDDENSTEDEWRGWCAHVGIGAIRVLQNGNLIEEVLAEDFESDPRFAVSRWENRETGESGPQGDLYQDHQHVFYGLHINVWMSFDFDLSPGEYEIDVDLVTYVDEGHPDDTMVMGLSWTEGYASSQVYEYGDTWYRDMRDPGFEGGNAPENAESIQWLGQKIANDPRFATATVKFWWPAIFGEPALAAPEDPSLPDYPSQLSAYNEQQALIKDLAAQFEAANFKAKSLFADMIMSPWFRTSEITDANMSSAQMLALESVGSGRLLTPEELDRKNRGVWGRTWGERLQSDGHQYEKETNLSRRWGGYGNFYGGIDGATVTTRNREMTALMSNVAERMATDLACQVVLEDFSRPTAQRRVFTAVEKGTDPLSLFADEFDLSKEYTPEQTGNPVFDVYSKTVVSSGDPITLRIYDASPEGCVQISDEEHACMSLGLGEVTLRKNGYKHATKAPKDFEADPEVAIDEWYNQETGERGIRGWYQQYQYSDSTSRAEVYWLHTNSWIEVTLDLPEGEYRLDVPLTVLEDSNRPHPSETVRVDLDVKNQALNMTSPGAIQVASQLDELVLKATGKPMSTEQQTQLLEAFVSHSKIAKSNGDWFNGHCDTWSIWGDQSYRTHEENWARYGDPDGTLAAWTMLVHQVMTSYSYLHD